MGAPQGGVQTVSGVVVETMNAATYTYVRVKTSTGDIWAASLQFPVAVGDNVVVPLETPMQNFKSSSLNREFSLIYFSSKITREGEPAPSSAQLMAAHGAAASAAPAETDTSVVEPIAPPDGGKTIAAVWAGRTALAGKPVTVRGKVVKYNGGILGTNWLHIQDGSGSAKDGTHDLTITTDVSARLGEIVTCTGTVSIDRDFGSGYAYKVMLEKASIVRR